MGATLRSFSRSCLLTFTPLFQMAFKYTGPTQLCINNQWVDAASGKKFKTINPATLDVIAEVSEGDKADVDKAVKAARVAFQSWRNVDGSQRSAIMHKIADIIDSKKDEFVALESADNGKPFATLVCSSTRASAAVPRRASLCTRRSTTS